MLDQNVYNGRTALHEAADSGHLEAAKALVQLGVDVDALDNEGLSALDIASSSDNILRYCYAQQYRGRREVAQWLSSHTTTSAAPSRHTWSPAHLPPEDSAILRRNCRRSLTNARVTWCEHRWGEHDLAEWC